MITFESLGIEEGLLRSISALGFTEPTPIQEKAIPVLLQGTKDFIGLAQTGTGKTAAFGITFITTYQKRRPFSAGTDRLPNQGIMSADRQ